MEGRDATPGAVRSTAKLTYDDLVAMFPEDDRVRRELIDGDLRDSLARQTASDDLFAADARPRKISDRDR
jgi:hypothetical protein